MAWVSGITDWKVMNWGYDAAATSTNAVIYTSGDTIYASGMGYDRIKEAVKKQNKSEVDLLDERVRKVCKAGRL